MKHEDRFKLDNKIAVVTGAASGIGNECACFLADMGATVILVDINNEAGKEAAKVLDNPASFICCDITKEEQCVALAEQIKAQHDKVDILVNCAGVIRRKDIVETSEADWDIVLNVGLKGIFLVSKHLIPVMASSGGGSIINIGSDWGIKGGPKAASYCAAKGGVTNLTRAMAIDHGLQHIRVNCVSPGDIDTPLFRDEARQLGVDEEKWIKESGESFLLGRLGKPRDIAMMVYFLASGLSSWVTGANFVVDGGGVV